MYDEDGLSRLLNSRQMRKYLGQATDQSREMMFENLRRTARAILEHRDDVASLTQDNKERMERRQMYKVEANFSVFDNALLPLFESLWTEDPPQVTS
jgi:hypothetical protein